MSLEQWAERGVVVTHSRQGYAAGHWGLFQWSMSWHSGRWEATGAIAGVGNEVVCATTQSAALAGLLRRLCGRMAITIARLKAQQQLMVGITPHPSPAHLSVLRALSLTTHPTTRQLAAQTRYSHTYVATILGELESLGLIDETQQPTRSGADLIKLMETEP